MTDINVVTLSGRLTRDAELKHTTSGLTILNFAIAVNRSVKQGDQWTEEASFFDCTLFGKLGEAISSYATKGKQVLLSGELKQDRWEKDGQKRSRVNIIVNRIQLIGGKADAMYSATPPDPVKTATDVFAPETDGDDDIPF